MDEKLTQNIARIIDLNIDGKNGIDLYLDITNYMIEQNYMSFIKKGGKLKNINYSSLTDIFLGYFGNGEINLEYCHDSPRIGEAIIYTYFNGMTKKGVKTVEKLPFLNNLALNGSRKSKEYRMMLNDKATRTK